MEDLILKVVPMIDCKNCCLFNNDPDSELDPCDLLDLDCESGFGFKLVKKEQEPIPSEYEWKKLRHDIIGNETHSKYMKEYGELHKWLKQNKPKKFQTCTKQNTSVGDKVCLSSDLDNEDMYFYEVKYISNNLDCFILADENGEDSNFLREMNAYLINVNNKKQE